MLVKKNDLDVVNRKTQKGSGLVAVIGVEGEEMGLKMDVDVG